MTTKKVVQCTGLPASGKTTGIQLFSSRAVIPVTRLDIRNYYTWRRELEFQAAINLANQSLIAESACGVTLSGSYVVRLEVPIKTLYENHLRRDGWVDEDYLSLLRTNMISPDYTVGSPDDLSEILAVLFEGTGNGSW